jgi:hypothetical protein
MVDLNQYRCFFGPHKPAAAASLWGQSQAHLLMRVLRRRGAGQDYFFISSSPVLASICMSIPAHTSLGDLALG